MNVQLFPALDQWAENVYGGNTSIYRNVDEIIAVNGSGAHCQGSRIYFGLHIGEGLRVWTPEGGVDDVKGPLGIGGNEIACAVAGDLIAIARPNPAFTRLSDGRQFDGYVSPAISDDGQHVAVLRQNDGALFVSRFGGPLEAVKIAGQEVRNCKLPRFGSTSLMAEMGDGRVIAIADVRDPAQVAAPSVFSFPGIPLLKPVPVWNPAVGILSYSCHTTNALLHLLWGQRMGWVKARGALDQGFHDARPTRGGRVRDVWTQGGALPDFDEQFTTITNPIDAIAAVSPSTPPGDVLWTKTIPIDLTPFIVGDDAHWPRSGDHEMDRRWDGRDLFWIKFGHPDHWEHWRLDGDTWLLIEDRSQSGAGDYSFHPGRWFPRVWTLGSEVVCNDNRIQEYEPATCALKASSLGNPRIFPYTLRFLSAWSRITLGGSIGTLTSPDDLPVAVLLEYDPGGPHDTRETGLFVRGWGSSRWQAYDQQTGALLIQTQWMTLGGQKLTPTQGCYRALEQRGSMSASLTITTPFPKTVAAGEDVVLEGKSTAGRFDRLFWRYRPHGSAQWTEKEDDFRTTLKFGAGVYDIGLRGEGPDGPAETGAQRLLTVTAAPSAAAITSADVQALVDTLEDEYRVKHQPSETFIDPPGRVLWPSKYLELRQQGRAHAGALAEVVSTIRRIEGREPQQPGGGGDPGGGPAGPDGGPAQVAFPAGLWAAFRAANPITWLRDEPSDAKDDKARQYVEAFVECLCWFLGPQWRVKNAGGTRPKSKDVAAHVGPGYAPGQAFFGFDIFSGVGTNNTTVNENPGGFVVTPDQIAFTVTPDRHGVSWDGHGGGDTGGDPEQPPTNVPDLTVIRVEGNRWVQQIIGASMLYGPYVDCRAALDEGRDIGFRIFRNFTGDLTQLGVSLADALQRLPIYLTWLRERGLKAYVSCGTNKDPGASWYQDCGDVLGDFLDVVLMTEGANEALQRGGWATPGKLAEYVAHLPAFTILSAPDGGDDLSLDYVWNGVRAFHFGRGRPASDLDKFASGFAGLNQEPIGCDETNQPGRRSNDVEFFRALGAGNRRNGFGGFYHSEAGLQGRPFGPVQRRAAIAFVRAMLGQ